LIESPNFYIFLPDNDDALSLHGIQDLFDTDVATIFIIFAFAVSVVSFVTIT